MASTRSKRRRVVNIQLSKLELQEYLDDGYTPSQIGKDIGVTAETIKEKMRKYGIRRQKKKVNPLRGRGRPSNTSASPPARGRGRTSNTSPPARSRGRPPKRTRPSSSSSGQGEIKSPHGKRARKDGETDDDVEEGTNPKLNSVLVQVINDNPSDDVDQVHMLVKSMGFDFEKSFVEEHMNILKKKGAADPSTTESEKEEKQEETPKRGRGRPRKSTEVKQLDDPKVKQEDITNKEPPGEGAEDEIEEVVGRNDIADDSATAENDASRENGVNEEEDKPKKRPGRPRKKPVKYEDSSSDENLVKEGVIKEEPDSDQDFKEDAKPKKRGRKKKHFTEISGVKFTKRGRPSLQLSEENLRHCIDSGLSRQKIAEVFGTCARSVTRYLQIHKMRKRDKFSKCSDDEIDRMVTKVCEDHPDWGQVQIQDELAKRGLLFRRAQIRNSVRRVDPVGIELRKLNNLKRRWNRGSLKKLDRILPADGINMTSTDSFLCPPPRTGLNGLNEEDSVRLLKEIVYSCERKYIEYPMPYQENKESGESESNEAAIQSEILIKAVEMVEIKKEDADEFPKVIENEENIGPDPSIQPGTSVEVQEENSSSESGADSFWKKRLYSMVMSNRRTGREAAAKRKIPDVYISKEDLQVCVDHGYSSSRIADRFNTSKHNVRKYLDLYKLGKSRRFEALSEQALDQLVFTLIKEGSILRGRDVYYKMKEKGYQIRKCDIRKSLCRLHPKGLNRASPSIMKQSWDDLRKANYSNETFVPPDPEDSKPEPNVIILDAADLARLMGREGNIVLVDDMMTNDQNRSQERQSGDTQGGDAQQGLVICEGRAGNESTHVEVASVRNPERAGSPDSDGGLFRGITDSRQCTDQGDVEQSNNGVAAHQPHDSVHNGVNHSQAEMENHGDDMAQAQQHATTHDQHDDNAGNGMTQIHQDGVNKADGTMVQPTQNECHGEDGMTQAQQYVTIAQVHQHDVNNTDGTTVQPQQDSHGEDGMTQAQQHSTIAQVHQHGINNTDGTTVKHGQQDSHDEDGMTQGQQHSTIAQIHQHAINSADGTVVQPQQDSHGEDDVVQAQQCSTIAGHIDHKPHDGITPLTDGSMVTVNNNVQSVATTEENQINAIILEFNIPQGQDTAAVYEHNSQGGHYSVPEQHSQEVYVVHESQDQNEIQRVVLVDDTQESQGGQQGHIILQLEDDAPLETDPTTSQGVSLTSLNTVQPSQLSAQVLLQLDRIAQNLQAQGVKEDQTSGQ